MWNKLKWLFLTNKCNLNCPYCFADEFVNKDCSEITFENFVKVLNFIKTNPNEQLGLIGGKPTLHPDFSKILEFLKDDKTINAVTIYTNGIELDKYIDILLDSKFYILINCNNYMKI